MSKKEVPFLSARTINNIDEYDRFHHTKAYLRSLTVPTDTKFQLDTETKSSVEELQAACGYGKLDKFLLHKADWDLLRRKIPLGYLEAIGLRRDVLDFAVELDQEEFERVIQLPLYPRTAVVRLMSCLYSKLTLPQGLDEQQAIDYLLEWMKETPLPCMIKFPSLKTVYLTPDGSINAVYHPPEITWTRTHAIPRTDGSRAGRAWIS